MPKANSAPESEATTDKAAQRAANLAEITQNMNKVLDVLTKGIDQVTPNDPRRDEAMDSGLRGEIEQLRGKGTMVMEPRFLEYLMTINPPTPQNAAAYDAMITLAIHLYDKRLTKNANLIPDETTRIELEQDLAAYQAALGKVEVAKGTVH